MPAQVRAASARRILIVRLSHLGDVVHALPVFHALRSAEPGAEIGWAVQPEFAGLLEGLPGLRRIFRFERRGGARAWPKLWSELREFAPDWAIDAQGNTKSALVTLGSFAARRSGLHRDDWREPLASAVLTDPVSRPVGDGAHAMEKMLALARHVAPGADPLALVRTDPGSSELELESARDLGSPSVILNLSSPDDVRSWPTGHFGTLARELAARGEQVLVLSGPAEEAQGRELERSVPEARHWIGQRGLRELAAFFTVSAARGVRYVGSDSGPMHLAAACGMRVVSLAGPQDERRTGPWSAESARHASVRAEFAPACAPCFSRTCDHPRGPVCMSGISPGSVARALEAVACG